MKDADGIQESLVPRVDRVAAAVVAVVILGADGGCSMLFRRLRQVTGCAIVFALLAGMVERPGGRQVTGVAGCQIGGCSMVAWSFGKVAFQAAVGFVTGMPRSAQPRGIGTVANLTCRRCRYMVCFHGCEVGPGDIAVAIGAASRSRMVVGGG